ncbi:putative inner membrane protein translocase component YidC [Mycoplasmopsis canis PG 14]|uniref:Putative inner membrane protein translocase component YidC n=2 Tax=Mycoplasmopsis canis TaxID=29555 RepID=A0A449ARP4_9BACT|nr:preprotein translocase YidC [Mycoplasmopsis canis PG 14]EIE41064.1 putative inner membrane protein translocase component YidC [Mycoplasmopsis canis PG 14]VEU69213.1 putative inner membrane protein translocase component YidC [Mycoplasmopsis canis]
MNFLRNLGIMQKKQKFNYFSNPENDPNEKRRVFFKKSWKITKILLYLFAFSVTLTGCVQSFVLKTSSNVGNSIEFYSNKEDIAPKLNTFKPESVSNTINKYDNEGNLKEGQEIKLSLDVLKQNEDANILVDNKDIIKKLSEQSSTNKGEYGKPGVFSSGFSTQDISNEKLSSLGYSTNNKNEKFHIIERNNKFLFRNESELKYSYVNDLSSVDNEILIWTYVPDSNVPFIELKKHEKNSVNSSGKEIKTQINSVDADGKYTVSYVSGLQKVDFVSEETLNAISESTTETKSIANRAFARDVLQTFYNYSFGKESSFLKELNKVTLAERQKSFASFSEYFKYLVSLITDKENKIKNNNEELFKLSQEEYAIINIYQEVVTSWMSKFGIVPARDAKSKFKTYLSNKIINSSNKYDVNKYSIEEFLIDYNSNVSTFNQNDKNEKTSEFYTNILFAGDYPIQPIYTWKQAWEYGPFYGLLVYPLSVMVQSLRQAMPELNGWATIIAILIAVIFTRLLVLAFSFKATMMQSIQEGLKSKKAAIEAKYIGFENNKTMKMKKNQEIQALYSKYNINPMDQFANLLLSMPIFFAMWRVIQGIPEIKQTVWLGINFSSVSWQKVTSGEFVYLWILIAAILVQLISQLLPQLLNRRKNNLTMTISEKQALKKSERTQRIMMIVFTGITILFSAGVQVYWLFGGLWQIAQVLGIHKLKKTKWFKQKYSKKMMKK